MFPFFENFEWKYDSFAQNPKLLTSGRNKQQRQSLKDPVFVLPQLEMECSAV